MQSCPLTAENKVVSPCCIRYNKWVNFTGFKFQLNKEVLPLPILTLLCRALTAAGAGMP